jgi:hypothetical protein
MASTTAGSTVDVVEARHRLDSVARCGGDGVVAAEQLVGGGPRGVLRVPVGEHLLHRDARCARPLLGLETADHRRVLGVAARLRRAVVSGRSCMGRVRSW